MKTKFEIKTIPSSTPEKIVPPRPLLFANLCVPTQNSGSRRNSRIIIANEKSRKKSVLENPQSMFHYFSFLLHFANLFLDLMQLGDSKGIKTSKERLPTPNSKHMMGKSLFAISSSNTNKIDTSTQKSWNKKYSRMKSGENDNEVEDGLLNLISHSRRFTRDYQSTPPIPNGHKYNKSNPKINLIEATSPNFQTHLQNSPSKNDNLRKQIFEYEHHESGNFGGDLISYDGPHLKLIQVMDDLQQMKTHLKTLKYHYAPSGSFQHQKKNQNIVWNQMKVKLNQIVHRRSKSLMRQKNTDAYVDFIQKNKIISKNAFQPKAPDTFLTGMVNFTKEKDHEYSQQVTSALPLHQIPRKVKSGRKLFRERKYLKAVDNRFKIAYQSPHDRRPVTSAATYRSTTPQKQGAKLPQINTKKPEVKHSTQTKRDLEIKLHNDVEKEYKQNIEEIKTDLSEKKETTSKSTDTTKSKQQPKSEQKSPNCSILQGLDDIEPKKPQDGKKDLLDKLKNIYQIRKTKKGKSKSFENMKPLIQRSDNPSPTPSDNQPNQSPHKSQKRKIHPFKKPALRTKEPDNEKIPHQERYSSTERDMLDQNPNTGRFKVKNEANKRYMGSSTDRSKNISESEDFAYTNNPPKEKRRPNSKPRYPKEPAMPQESTIPNSKDKEAKKAPDTACESFRTNNTTHSAHSSKPKKVLSHFKRNTHTHRQLSNSHECANQNESPNYYTNIETKHRHNCSYDSHLEYEHAEEERRNARGNMNTSGSNIRRNKGNWEMNGNKYKELSYKSRKEKSNAKQNQYFQNKMKEIIESFQFISVENHSHLNQNHIQNQHQPQPQQQHQQKQQSNINTHTQNQNHKLKAKTNAE
jgi:hypothetical protein